MTGFQEWAPSGAQPENTIFYCFNNIYYVSPMCIIVVPNETVNFSWSTFFTTVEDLIHRTYIEKYAQCFSSSSVLFVFLGAA
jgi:hypothetical protein